MKELPILFSTPMVQAILENRKKMTRRTAGLEMVNENPDNWQVIPHNGVFSFEDPTFLDIKPIECKPKYIVYDHIWIKETYYAYGYWLETGNLTKTCKTQYKFIDLTLKRRHKYMYETGSEKPNKVLGHNAVKDGVYGWFKRPSLFMPRVASRITLECTGVRCERLQDITEADAISEGITFDNQFQRYDCPVCDNKGHKGDELLCDDGFFSFAKNAFQSLWHSINGVDSWDKNPWVFVYEFNRIEK